MNPKIEIPIILRDKEILSSDVSDLVKAFIVPDSPISP